MIWQTMESAPKTGEEFDAWDGKLCCRVANVYWEFGCWVSKGFDGNDYCDDIHRDLTHWMPLPNKPE